MKHTHNDRCLTALPPYDDMNKDLSLLQPRQEHPVITIPSVASAATRNRVPGRASYDPRSQTICNTVNLGYNECQFESFNSFIR